MNLSINIDGFDVNIRGSTGAIIVGAPGSGKSVLTSYFMLRIMQMGGFVVICDTKRSDFYSLSNILENGKDRVVASPNGVARLLRQLNDLMNNRYKENSICWGSDWVDMNLRPVLVIFDEYSATIAEADIKTRKEINDYLRQLIFKSRQMGGIYTILASQRLTADTLDRNISSEFATRIGMNNLDRISQSLAFPSCELDEVPHIQNEPGHGLIYDDHFHSFVPQPFIAPDMSEVDVPEVVSYLDKVQNHAFSKESYWPW